MPTRKLQENSHFGPGAGVYTLVPWSGKAFLRVLEFMETSPIAVAETFLGMSIFFVHGQDRCAERPASSVRMQHVPSYLECKHQAPVVQRMDNTSLSSG